MTTYLSLGGCRQFSEFAVSPPAASTTYTNSGGGTCASDSFIVTSSTPVAGYIGRYTVTFSRIPVNVLSTGASGGTLTMDGSGTFSGSGLIPSVVSFAPSTGFSVTFSNGSTCVYPRSAQQAASSAPPPTSIDAGDGYDVMNNTSCYDAPADMGYFGVVSVADAKTLCEQLPGCAGFYTASGGNSWALRYTTAQKSEPGALCYTRRAGPVVTSTGGGTTVGTGQGGLGGAVLGPSPSPSPVSDGGGLTGLVYTTSISYPGGRSCRYHTFSTSSRGSLEVRTTPSSVTTINFGYIVASNGNVIITFDSAGSPETLYKVSGRDQYTSSFNQNWVYTRYTGGAKCPF